MGVTRSTEVELKYAVPEPATLPDLAGAAGIAAEVAQPDAHLEAVYLDTADRALLRARIALRRRTGGHDAGWHLKLPAVAGRTELHAPIDPAQPDALPAAFERALRSRLRGRDPQPLARIVTERRGRVVTGTAGGRVEVVDDEVRATDVAAGAVRSWREWEAERLDDSPAGDAALAAVDAALLGAGARRSASPAKLAQALGGATAPRRKLRTAGDRLVAMAAPLVDDVHHRLTAMAVDGDPDGSGVHELRKTLRRLRSLLALEPVTGPLGAALRDALGALAAELGEARDPLVGAAAAESLLQGLPPEVPGTAEARVALVDEPRASVPGRTAAAIEALLSDDALAVWALLDRFVDEGPDGPQAARPQRRLVRLAEHSLQRSQKRARQSVHGDLEALHRARKAAKRSRMVAEELVVAGMLAKRSALAKAARRATRVQETLGEHRDLALVLDGLPSVAARVAAGGGNAFALGRLAERGEARLDHLHRTAVRSMRRLVR